MFKAEIKRNVDSHIFHNNTVHIVLQLMVVSTLHQMPPEGDRSRMGAQFLADVLSLPLLSHLPPRVPVLRPLPAGHARLGGGVLGDRRGCRPRRTTL